jgi:hypothetical protein
MHVLMADTIEEIIRVSDWAKMKAAEIVENIVKQAGAPPYNRIQ